jgi:hypothetical protein
VTPYEARLLLGVAVLIAVVSVYLIVSQIWVRRRRPPRALEQLASIEWQPGSSTAQVSLLDRGRLELARRGVRGVYFPSRPTDWLQEDPDQLFQWPTSPPSTPFFDQARARRRGRGDVGGGPE